MVKIITTLEIRLPLNNEVISKVVIMKRHKVIERLFYDFWGLHNEEVRSYLWTICLWSKTRAAL